MLFSIWTTNTVFYLLFKHYFYIQSLFPSVGWLFDVLQRYPPSFYLGGATIGAAGVMIFIPRFVRTPTSQLTVDAIILDVETGARLKSLCGEELV